MVQKTSEVTFNTNQAVTINIDAIEFVYIQFEGETGTSFSYEIRASRDSIQPNFNAIGSYANPHFPLEIISEGNSSTAGSIGTVVGASCQSYKLNTDGVKWLSIVVTSLVGKGRIKFFTT